MPHQEPGFVGAFDWAVVRLATFFPASASQARLLFGTATLLTKDRPRPFTSKGVESRKVGKGKSGKVFFRRTVLSANEAVAWYRSLGAGGIKTPVPSEPTEVERGDGTDLSPTSFEDDPEWPSFGIPLGTDLFSNAGGPGDPAPFRGSGAPRIHRRFGDNEGFESVIADQSVLNFLRRRIHLDLSDYMEYLGGVALIIPDPVLRRVQHFLVPGKESGNAERVVYRLVPRPDQKIDNLKLTVIERRANLLSRFNPVDAPTTGVVSVESGLPFHQTGYVISHPIEGVIAYQQPLPFIRSVKASLGITGRKVKIQVPKTESPDSPNEVYNVTEYAHEIPVSVGEERRDAVITVVKAEQRRIQRAAARRYKQTWFDDNQRDKAIAFLRRQLASARSSVLVADPYFGARQILQFLHAVPRTQVDFTILTSRLAFENDHAVRIDAMREDSDQIADPGGATSEDERLAAFAKALETLRTRGMRHVEALVLSEKSPPLHDRFLVIDSEVLFLGNSLNALGKRASLILSVPDSEPILMKLQAMMKQATPYDGYVSERQPQKPTQLDEA